MGPDDTDPNKCKIKVKAVPTPDQSSDMTRQAAIDPLQKSLLQQIDATSNANADSANGNSTSLLAQMLAEDPPKATGTHASTVNSESAKSVLGQIMSDDNRKLKSPGGSSTETADSAELHVAKKPMGEMAMSQSDNAAAQQQDAFDRARAIGKPPPGFAVLKGNPMALPGTETIRQSSLHNDVLDSLGVMYDANPQLYQELTSSIEVNNVYGQAVNTSSIINEPSATTYQTINPYDVIRLNINSVTDQELAAKLDTQAVTITRQPPVKRSAVMSLAQVGRKGSAPGQKKVKSSTRSGAQRSPMKAAQMRKYTKSTKKNGRKKKTSGSDGTDVAESAVAMEVDRQEVDTQMPTDGNSKETSAVAGSKKSMFRPQGTGERTKSASLPNSPMPCGTHQRRRPQSAPLTVNTTLANEVYRNHELQMAAMQGRAQCDVYQQSQMQGDVNMQYPNIHKCRT